jgi:hypothetical protein
MNECSGGLYFFRLSGDLVRTLFQIWIVKESKVRVLISEQYLGSKNFQVSKGVISKKTDLGKVLLK